MDRKLRSTRQILTHLGQSTALASFIWLASGIGADAQTAPTQDQIKALQEQINQLQAAVNALKAQQQSTAPAQHVAAASEAAKPNAGNSAQPASVPAGLASAPAQPAQAAGGTQITIGNQPIQLYGKVDVSGTLANNTAKQYLELTTNNSYFGLRTSSTVDDDLKVLVQIEGEVAVTNTPTTRSAFGFRDSYLGLQNSSWGTLKIGKGDTPYKRALTSIDPLTNTVGDARALFANTGGDNRAEFSLRAPHAIWWESPEFKSDIGSFQTSLMISPGQNPGNANEDWAFGETVCAGGSPAQGPGSSGSGQAGIAGAVGSGTGECTDGGFGTLVSGNVTYKNDGFLFSASAELHDNTNRSGDEAPPLPPAGSVGTRNEYGFQVLAGEDFGAVKAYLGFDVLRRDAIAAAYNERSKEDYFASIAWRVTENNVLAANFVYATKTPGDPAFFPHTDNAAEMVALGIRHYFAKQLSVYLVGALTDNHNTAHYDLGSSALGQPILARGAIQSVAIPGKTIEGLSLGASYGF